MFFPREEQPWEPPREMPLSAMLVAKLVAVHWPGNVPIHLMEQVKAGLDKDVHTDMS